MQIFTVNIYFINNYHLRFEFLNNPERKKLYNTYY